MPNKNEERENEKMAKKLKKVFALLLTLSMVMSLLSVTALAKGHDGWPWGKPDDSKPTETEPAIPGSNDEVKVYLRYSNKVPDILKDHAAAEFGPSGNNKPYFTVKVNAGSLEDAVNSNEVYCYTRVSDNRKLYTYYSAQEDEQADKPSLEELQNAWDAILGCMSKADQQKFADTFGRSYDDEMNFVGYVLKKEGNDWHIDGILNVKPGYITEFYLSSDGGRNYDLKDNSVEGSAMSGDTAYAKIEAMIQGVTGYDANSLRWNEEKTGGTFAVNGKVASFTVDEKSAKINDEVTYKNTSTDIYTAQIYVTVNITNEPADPFVNLSIEKRADKTSVQQGGELTYAIAVENNGNATATNVVITDTLPEGVEFKSASNEGKMVDGTVTWNIGELTAGAEKEVTVTVSVADDATVDEKITNTAFVTSDDEKEPKKDTVTTEVTTKQTPVDPVDPAKLPAPVVDKKATKLDENDKTTVTLSIGAEQGKTVSDVVFVLDKSTSMDVRAAAKDMLNELMTQAGENRIKVGVVVFNRNGNRTLELTELSEENLPKIEAALDEKMSSGSNIQAGLAAGKAMLDEDKSVASGAKHLVLVSDGVTYMWGTEEPPMTIYSEQIENQCESINAGNDMMGKHHPDAAAYFAEFQDAAAWYAKYGDAISADINAYADTYESAYYKPVEQGNMENSEYDCGKNYIPGEDLAKHYCANDAAVYMTIHEWEKIVNSGYSAYAYADQKHASSYPWAPDYVESLDTIGGISGAIPADKAGMFSAVQSRILYAMDKGTVTDKIGNHFDLTTVDSFELKVGGEAVSKVVDGNTVTFDSGKYVVKYQPATADNSEEQFVWIINTPVENAKGLELSYVLKLVDKETTPGDHTALTNEEAILEYTPTEGEKGEEEFPKPEVDYNIPDDPGPVDPKPTPAAKLVVDKAAPATVKQGENLTYTITVENKGDATAKNVVIKDTLPEGVEFKSANNEGKMVDGTITWNIGELAAGEKKTVTVVVSVPSDATVGEIISNTAVVTSDDEEEPKEDTVKTEVKPKDDGKKDDDDDDDDDRKKPSDPGTDIGEDPTPLDPGPDVPGTEIPESDVPLAEVPKTGDAAALWMILAGVSALGLAVVTFTTRKKENN